MASSKGSAFEREICKQLSLWWTGGARDDVFWRSQASGARATMRRRKKQETAGQYGDIAATDPIGHPLTERITFELKRGYAHSCPFDALDSATTATQQFTGFLKQAIVAAASAETPFWALISRRDRHAAIITVPASIFSCICRSCWQVAKECPEPGEFLRGELFPISTYSGKPTGMKSRCSILSCRLEDFLIHIKPEMVKAILL